jgi:hypothetical protein
MLCLQYNQPWVLLNRCGYCNPARLPATTSVRYHGAWLGGSVAGKLAARGIVILFFLEYSHYDDAKAGASSVPVFCYERAHHHVVVRQLFLNHIDRLRVSWHKPLHK